MSYKFNLISLLFENTSKIKKNDLWPIFDPYFGENWPKIPKNSLFFKHAVFKTNQNSGEICGLSHIIELCWDCEPK